MYEILLPMFRSMLGSREFAVAIGGLLFVFTGLVVYLLSLPALMGEVLGAVGDATDVSALLGSAVAAIGGLLFVAVPGLAALVLIKLRAS